MDADAGIGRAGAAGDEAYARPAGHRSVGAGHEGGAAFLAAGDRLDRSGVMQCIEHWQEAFAGDGEDAVAALAYQAIDKQARGALGSGFIHYRSLAGSASRGNAILAPAGACRRR